MSAVLKARNVSIAPSRCELFPYQNNVHVATVEEGTTIEDILGPQFFAHIANRLRMYDKIFVRTDDGAFYAELLVLATGPTWAKTKVLLNVKLTDEVVSDLTDTLAPYEVRWRGPQLKFSLVRKSDSAVIREHFESKAEAQQYMADYMRQTT